jgi:hypothetical protein
MLLGLPHYPAREVPPSFKAGIQPGWPRPAGDLVDRADIVVKSVRLTDNGDQDGFADPNETVSLFVTLRNSSGADREGIVVTVASADPTVDCIPSPVVAFGSLLAGEERESPVAAVFRVANLARSDPFGSLTASFDFQIAGDDFGGTVRRQQVVLDLDLNASGGLLPSAFTEGFEGTGFGTFTTMTLDHNLASLALSDGHRCQYSDPDFSNSGSYGNTFCFLGFTNGANNAYDWHVHGTSSPEGGRAYLGSQALHWGVHTGAASADTTRLKQLDAIRTSNTINLGWNGVTSVLSFKHQIGLSDGDHHLASWNQAVDRGVVHIQLANSSGTATGTWRKIHPYENVYDMQGDDHFTNCTFDPTDDGNTEDDYFDPTDPARRLGPSSTCGPEFVFASLGSTIWNAAFDPTDIHHAGDGPGLSGARGPGTWVQSKFDLSRYRGRRIRLRFLATSLEVGTATTIGPFYGVPTDADDGWYIDDVQVTNTLVSAATVAVDTADRSSLPACGPVCGSVTASLTASPPTADADEAVTLDASGSVADQCPGGTLHARFGRDHDQDGVLDIAGLWEFDEPVVQEWGPDATATDIPNSTMSYLVEVRCSTRPACAGHASVVVPLVCSSMEPVPFPAAITWASNVQVVWPYEGLYVDAIRGDLDGLRASGGHFDDTVQLCLVDGAYADNFVDVTLPAPGQGFYYLVKQPGSLAVCAFGSWGTGSPAEVAGAGGDRNADIPLDPDTCGSH